MTGTLDAVGARRGWTATLGTGSPDEVIRIVEKGSEVRRVAEGANYQVDASTTAT